SILQIRNEPLGADAVDHCAGIGSERTHRVHVCLHSIRMPYCLRKIGSKYGLREPHFLEAEPHPFGAPRCGMIGAGPAGAVVEQPLLEIVIEWFPRSAAVAGNG